MRAEERHGMSYILHNAMQNMFTNAKIFQWFLYIDSCLFFTKKRNISTDANVPQMNTPKESFLKIGSGLWHV